MKTQTPNIFKSILYPVLFVCTFFLVSCKDDADEELTPSNEMNDVALEFIKRKQLIILPSGLLASTDAMAKNTVETVKPFNDMMEAVYAIGDLPRAEAVYSAIPLIAVTGDVDVYTWNDATTGEAWAYQISEQNDRYVFDVFGKDGKLHKEWFRLLHAEEKKDKSSSFVALYNPLESNPNVLPYVSYTWTLDKLEAHIDIADSDNPSVKYKFTLSYNKTDKSGSYKMYSNNVLTLETAWDTKGSGKWRSLNVDGNFVEFTWKI